ncbi:MAG: hypothetical protein NTY77_03960 [Elusimicrobia bacterium]|nr:hypothetical protein [Elusimicrobiota bacterium]
MRKAFLTRATAALLAAAALASCGGPALLRPAWVSSAGAEGTGIDGVGFGAYQASDPGGVKKARDMAYSDALQKLSLKLRAVVRGEVKTTLQAEARNGSEVSSESVESMTGSMFDAVLGRKRFEEYRDERRREYWVLCSMSREEAAAALKEALAAAERRRSRKSVSLRLSGLASGLLKLAQSEFTRRFDDEGFMVLPAAQAGSARIAVSGELKTEELGAARPLGVDVGFSCRATLRPEAVVAQGSPGERLVAGLAPKDATAFGRTPAEACEKAAQNAAAQAAGALVAAVSRAIED